MKRGVVVKFYTVRDLRTQPRQIWEKLSEVHELIITNNGKPSALMIEIDDENMEDVLSSLRQSMAMRATIKLRSRSMINGNVIMCFDSNMIAEYNEVLKRPKSKFNQKDVDQVIEFIAATGFSVVPTPLQLEFSDEDDKIFYEVAIHVNGHLVTGNTKHFPKEPIVVTAVECLEILEHRN